MFSQSDYYTALPALPTSAELAALAERVFGQVFRHDFNVPGVALLSLGRAIHSTELRRFMVMLKKALNELYFHDRGKHLVYLSLARFDQQVTTKFHLDGAPEEAYLMLGYEPTAVPSRVAIADYTRAAHDWGIEPRTLLTDHNPMYADHEQRLVPYITVLEGFDPTAAQILLTNNSSLPYRPMERHSLGVMHQATILTPMPDQSRVVNSTMIGTAENLADEPMGQDTQRTFIETQAVAGEVGMA